jgi:type III restriction enzyme
MELVKLTTVYNPIKEIPDINVNRKIQHEFDYSVHQYYSNLNPLELEAARVIDSLRLDWTRNPVFSGYGIPLLSQGFTKKFYPDFLVWVDDDTVLAIETTGKDLLSDKLDRKLFTIENFSVEEAKKHAQIIPPSKIIVGVITTTNVWGKYKVYRMDENGKQEYSETMDMEGCIKEILGKV